MINTASPASNNVHGRENGFDITKLIHQNMSSAVVQFQGVACNVQMIRVRLPATLYSVSFLVFILFLILFFLLACFPLLTLLTLLIMHLDQYM